jgi:hypothetical protein
LQAVIRKLFRWVEYFWKTLLLRLIPDGGKFMIVTGADTTHAKSLGNLLRSIQTWAPDIPVVVYDLGLTKEEVQGIRNMFPAADIRSFNFSQYPDYFDIRKNAGEFAWKPVLFSDVFEEFRCGICWFDAGNLVTGPLTALRKVTAWKGFYSPFVKGTVEEWTHPATIAYMHAEPIRRKANLAGGCVAADFRFAKSKAFVRKWRECALTRDCIAPPGSDRYNHRQDMSVLTILAYQLGLPLFMSSFKLGFIFQQDVG